ncbi:hypothetical protein [Nitrosomonas sp.]|uniref:hypothetical protein n=1 Tax=Nitrosomonas sp. TaxID=42353 RepID=UPI0020840D1A|nr:hypothetical protein [Nitrosomonas sp.]GJL75874.1 MAG: hypothetical protein NMNS02_19800 [Nitrosomonas sp.]
MKKTSKILILVCFYIIVNGCANLPVNDINAISTPSYPPSHYTASVPSMPQPRDMRLCVNAEPIIRHISSDINFQETPTIEMFCERFREKNPEYLQCYSDCEISFSKNFSNAKDDRRKRDEYHRIEQERIAAQQRKAEELEKSAKFEEQSLVIFHADLRSGKVAPENIDQAKIAYDAGDGYNIAKSPKLRPDDQLYALSGSISEAEDGTPVFFGEIVTWSKSLIPTKEFNHVGVRIPDELQDYYFSNARINSRFDIIGKYIENAKYETVTGWNEVMPLFEAVYFVIR